MEESTTDTTHSVLLNDKNALPEQSVVLSMEQWNELRAASQQMLAGSEPTISPKLPILTPQDRARGE